MLDYFLEKNDPALQDVKEFLRLYDEPYKVTLTSGKALSAWENIPTYTKSL